MGSWVVALFASTVVGGAPAAAPVRLQPAAGSPLAVGGSPNGIESADLNGDGTPDLVVTDEARSSVSHLTAVGDLDRDGHADLVATGHDSHGVFVWLGDGSGRLRAAQGSPFPALTGGRAHNHGLALGDLNADDALDVATTDDEAHVVAVLLGDGRGGCRPAARSPFAVGREPYLLALGDLNGGRRRDGRSRSRDDQRAAAEVRTRSGIRRRSRAVRPRRLRQRRGA